MSEDSRTTGKAIETKKSAIEILKELGIDHEFTEEELLDGEFLELMYENETTDKFIVIARRIFELTNFQDSNDIYDPTFIKNDDGSFNFDFIYYNGGCHWTEIFEGELDKIEDER